MKPRVVDLAILGGGCAGLSLARELAVAERSGREIPKVLILEARPECSSSKTWCFWERNGVSGASLASHRWPGWSFSSATKACRHNSDDWSYACVKGEKFFEEVFGKIAPCPSIDVLTNRSVGRVDCLREGLLLQAGDEQVLCRHLVDTRPPGRRDQLASKLFQVFLGFEVRAKVHTADLRNVGLMESMVSDGQGFRFDYILPLEPDRLLVEATRFSTEPLSEDQLLKDLQHSLSGVIPSGEFTILRREFGIIPMGLPDLPQPADPRWVNAGTRGGALRSASGYAFAEIQEWAAACAKSILEQDRLLPHPPGSRILKAMDDLFLGVLADRPDLAPSLFLTMARRLDAATFCRFMTGRSSPWELLKVVRSLPFRPFLLRLAHDLGLPSSPPSTPKATS